MTVPESRVTLAVPVDSVLSLPSGAVYQEKSGQARVRIGRKAADTPSGGEVIVVEATCDSLQLLCEEYEQTIISLHQALQSSYENVRTVSERRSKGFWGGVLGTLGVLGVLGILRRVVFSRRVKN